VDETRMARLRRSRRLGLRPDGAALCAARPEALAVTVSGEAENVNSLDEVPDSAWFTNRERVPAGSDPLLGACTPALVLDPDHSPDGTWIIDRGKEDGAGSGFRVNVPGKGKYMFKADSTAQPELETAASVVGAAIYHAAGFHTACEQIVYFRPSLLKLSPGLHYRHSSVEDEKDFDPKALDQVLASCGRRGALVRMHASAWVPGYGLGPFHYDGTRVDDPSDVIPHERRRDLRALRLLAAWTDAVDSRDANSLDSWFVDQGTVPDASPGHVVHYCMDFSHTLGPDFGSPQRTERLGFSYVFDANDMAVDFFALGIPRHPWFRPTGEPGYELFRRFRGPLVGGGSARAREPAITSDPRRPADTVCEVFRRFLAPARPGPRTALPMHGKVQRSRRAPDQALMTLATE
jgi:hypothetical protein